MTETDQWLLGWGPWSGKGELQRGTRKLWGNKYVCLNCGYSFMDVYISNVSNCTLKKCIVYCMSIIALNLF